MSRANIAKFDPKEKVWIGPLGKYPYAMDTFVGEVLLECFDKNPEKVIQINHDEGTEWIAKDLKLSAIRVAQNLSKLGINSDDVVGINARNTEKIYPVVLGCVLTGALTNTLHVSFNIEAIKQMWSQTKPKIVVCDSDVYETTKAALDELKNDAKIFTLLDKVPGVSFIDELLAATENENNFVAKKFDTTADKKSLGIMCSSGTTGEPVNEIIQSHFLNCTTQLLNRKEF